MNLNEAKELLNTCTRSELRDHAFGDTEVYWEKDGVDVALGYFSDKITTVGLCEPFVSESFEGDEALELRKCGIVGNVERNDETGPETYQEGVTMPGLTLEGVRQELTGEVK